MTEFQATDTRSDDEDDGQPEDSDDEDVENSDNGDDVEYISVLQSDVPTEAEEDMSAHNDDERGASSRPTSPSNDFATESHRSSSHDIPLSQS